MNGLVVNLTTKSIKREPLRGQDIAQRQKDQAKHDLNVASRLAMKTKKDIFLASLSADQREGFEAILKDGRID